jgi:hypothetical protein
MDEFYQKVSQSSEGTPYFSFLARLTQMPLSDVVALRPFLGFWG